MSSRTVLLSLLVAFPALGRGFVLAAPGGIRLQTAEPTTCQDGDVCVDHNRLQAAHGIRLETRQPEFGLASPIVLDEPYLVRDAQGGEYRLWVHDAVGTRLAVEVLSTKDPLSTGDSTGLAGRYKVVAVRIGGEATDARYPELRLDAEGMYHLGSTTGVWSTDRVHVTLSGHFSSWGPGTLDTTTGKLTFTFQRGALAFEISFSRIDAAAVVAASRP